MKILNSLVAITLLGAASVAGAQINIPNPQLPGGSFESACTPRGHQRNDARPPDQTVVTHALPRLGRDPHEFQDLGEERYAIVYITSPTTPAARVFPRAAIPGRWQ
jgi:hypothetical protein